MGKTGKFFNWLGNAAGDVVVDLGSWIGLDETLDKLLAGKPLKGKTGEEWYHILQKELNNLIAKGQVNQAQLDDLNETIVRLGNSFRTGHVKKKVNEYETKIREKAAKLRSDINKNEALVSNIQDDINSIANKAARKIYKSTQNGIPQEVQDIRDNIKYVEGRMIN